MPRVYTPNPTFSGFRNAGRKSTSFKNGVAKCQKATADFFVKTHGYYCPELYPEHAAKVAEIRPDFDNAAEEKAAADNAAAEKPAAEKPAPVKDNKAANKKVK